MGIALLVKCDQQAKSGSDNSLIAINLLTNNIWSTPQIKKKRNATKTQKHKNPPKNKINKSILVNFSDLEFWWRYKTMRCSYSKFNK
jgi:hypothetical protein